MKRRTLLGFGAAVATVPLDLPAVGSPAGGPAVRLLDSRYRQNMLRTVAYLRFVDLDRLLHMFRVTAGLPSAAEPCGGWEAPDVQLRGHTTGHLLSGLAQAAYWLGDAELRARSERLVAALASCQAPNGYLSAFPETTFDELEAGKNPWAPYYTIHKILAGLLDQHRLLGSAAALRVAVSLASWAYERTGKLTREQMQKVLHVEFGGMNEALINLYGVTRDPRHLELARRFDHDEIFDPLAERRDTLAGRHANTDIAKIVGAAAAWQATGEQRYRTIAHYFWEQVVGHHTYVIGGNANAEFFGPPDQVVSQLGENTCENCNSYNMLKLTRRLHLASPERAEYMDYYEWTLLNQMLGEQDPDSAHGNVTYYTGLSQNARRKGKDGLVADPGSYSSDYDNFSCDHGSGLETHTKFAEPIYDTAGDTLRVNLFVPSEVDFRGVRFRLVTEYPYRGTIRLEVLGPGSGATTGGGFAVRVRVPGWAAGASVRVRSAPAGGGEPGRPGDGVPVAARAGTYVAIRRVWRKGDTVELTLPMRLSWRPAPDNPQVKALTYGPLVLAGRFGAEPPAVVPTVDPVSLRREAGTAEFSVVTDGVRRRFSPFLDVHHEYYGVYFAVPPTVTRRGVVASYPLGSLREGTGRWGDAVLAGGAVAGERGIELNGKGAHVVLPAGLPAGLTELTVSAAVRLNSIANSARVFDLGFNTQSYMFLTPRTGNGTARFAMKLGGMEGEDFVDADVALPVGVWTRVTVSVGETLRLFVDDRLAGENPAPRMGALLLGATHFNYLGRSQNPKHPYLDGAVADFTLRGRA